MVDAIARGRGTALEDHRGRVRVVASENRMDKARDNHNGQNGRHRDPVEIQSLAEMLGVPDDFAPDWMSPPVDRDLIRRFVRSEADEPEREQVLDFITAFRPWREALREVLR